MLTEKYLGKVHLPYELGYAIPRAGNLMEEKFYVGTS
jgi:hypothetical protein